MMVNRAAAQATLTLTGGSGAPGASVTVSVSLNTNGTAPAAVQFDLTYPSYGSQSGGGDVLFDRQRRFRRRKVRDLQYSVGG